MASVYKPKYTRPIPEGATRCTHKGKLAVRHTDKRGKTHVRPIHLDRDGHETGKVVCEQQTWWMKYRLPDGTVRYERGFKDKLASEQEAARREREAHQAAAGILLVDPKHLTTPIHQHIDAYRDSLERKGKSPDYYGSLHTRLTRTAESCGWQTLRQITPASLEGYLSELTDEGLSPRTVNHYLAGAKSFVTWCIRTRRLAGNPLESVERTDNHKENDKAALTREQAEALLAAAGPRRLLYFVALRTGLRRGELEALQWGDVRLDAGRPHITLRAAATKAKRADTVPLRADVAAELRAACPADAKLGDKVFGRIPRMRDLRPDFRRAGIPEYDERGKKYCFHSLRVTLGTWLAQAGVAPRVHMELMRHTDMKLTMQFYTDPRLLDTTRAVDDLPDLGEPNERTIALRTGTDDLPLSIHQKYGTECPGASTSVHFGNTQCNGNAVFAGAKGEDGGGGGNRTHVRMPVT